jgi:O-antigen/teichoic acid export membrane protein
MKKIYKKIIEHPQFSYFAKSSSATMFSYFITAFFTVFISYTFANFLDPDTFGNYRFVFAFYSILGAITLGGMPVALTRSIASGYEKSLLDGIKLKIIFSIIGFIITTAIAIYYFVNGNMNLAFGFFALGIALPLFEIPTLILPYLQGHQNFWDVAKYQIFSKFLVLILSLIAIFYFPAPGMIILLSIGLVGIIQTFYAIKIYREQKEKRIENLSKHNIKADEKDGEFAKYTINLSFMGIIYILGMQADKLILFKLFGSVSLAGYTIATLLPLEFQRMVGNLTSIYFPKLVKAEKNDIKNKLLKILSLATFVCILISTLYHFIAPFVFHTFFPQYVEYIFYSQLAFWGICFVPFAFLWSYFSAKGNTKVMYFLHIADPITQILLYILLVPKYHITGLIIATLFKNFLFNVFAILFFIKK